MVVLHELVGDADFRKALPVIVLDEKAALVAKKLDVNN